jgi:hypothetical protein
LRGADTVTLTGTAEEFAGTDYSDYLAFDGRGVDFLHVTTGAATFDIDIAFSALDGALRFTDSDAITVEVYELWDLEEYSFAAVKDVGVDVVAFGSSVQLTLAEALSAVQSGLSFTADETISIDADAGEIQSIRNLTAAEFTALGNLGVDLLVIPNGNPITLDLAQVLAMANSHMAFGSGFTAYLTTSNFNLENVTAAQWTALGATGFDLINADPNVPIALDVDAAKAFAATGINFNGDYTIIVTATPAELSALTEADYAALVSKGFDYVQSTTGAFTVDADQALAFIDAGLKFVVGDAVTVQTNGLWDINEYSPRRSKPPASTQSSSPRRLSSRSRKRFRRRNPASPSPRPAASGSRPPPARSRS